MSAYVRKDAFHQRAKREGFRSRAAYKLAEIQRREKLLRPGQRVVELGCWPGGWLQIASAAVGPSGRVVGVDLKPTEPFPNHAKNANAVALTADLSELTVVPQVLELLGRPADVFLSDAAPQLTGVRATDRAREEALLEALAERVPSLLRMGGSLLMKLLDGPEAADLARRLGARFERSRTLRPAATRSGSSERYLVARGYRGPEQ